MVIHRNSKHPVLVKKIALNIWLLRDEIENVIKNRLLYAKQNNLECDISDIKEEYSNTKETSSPSPDNMLESLQKKDDDKSSSKKDDKEKKEEKSNELEASSKSENDQENKKENSEDDSKDESVEKDNPEKTQEEEDLEKAMMESLDEPVDISANSKENSEEKKEEKVSEKTKIYQRVLNLDKDQIYTGKTILSEIYMDQIYMFVDQHFFDGQSIVLEFQIPKKFTLNADIIFCAKYNLRNRIISKYNLSHRVCAKFTFLKKGEKTLLRQFLSSVEPEVDHAKEESKPESDDGGIDDVLDGLDL